MRVSLRRFTTLLCLRMSDIRCFICGEDLIWDSDVNAHEVFAEYGDDDSAAMSYYHCPKCGRSYEVCEPCREERESTYKEYWK